MIFRVKKHSIVINQSINRWFNKKSMSVTGVFLSVDARTLNTCSWMSYQRTGGMKLHLHKPPSWIINFSGNFFPLFNRCGPIDTISKIKIFFGKIKKKNPYRKSFLKCVPGKASCMSVLPEKNFFSRFFRLIFSKFAEIGTKLAELAFLKQTIFHSLFVVGLGGMGMRTVSSVCNKSVVLEKDETFRDILRADFIPDHNWSFNPGETRRWPLLFGTRWGSTWLFKQGNLFPNVPASGRDNHPCPLKLVWKGLINGYRRE